MLKLVECSYLSGCAGARKEGRRIGHSLSSIYGNAHTFFPSFHKTEPSLFPAFLCSPQVIPSKCPPQSHCSYIYIYLWFRLFLEAVPRLGQTPQGENWPKRCTKCTKYGCQREIIHAPKDETNHEDCKKNNLIRQFGRDMLEEEQFPNHHQCPFDRGDVEQEGIGSTNLKQQNKV